MMNLIQQVHTEYNENVLSDNYKNVNGVPWTATNLTGATMVESEDYTYEEGRSLHLNILGYDVDETEFAPTTVDDFYFEVPKTGTYIFSFRVLSPAIAPYFPEFVGRFFLNEMLGTSIPLEFKIGNNTIPEFTFEYRRWQTFYAEVTLVQGETYTLSGEIDKEPTWFAGPVDLYFAGFKLEYTSDKIYNIPTYYTKPSFSGATSTSFIEVNANTQLEPYHKTINVIANTVSVTLPAALQCSIGKEILVTNKGAGIVTLFKYGIDSIDGSSSKVIPPGCGVRVVCARTSWRIVDFFRLETLNRTQWIQNIALTTINNATSLNLLTLVPNASKSANGTDGGVNTLDIVSNGIKTNWRGVIQSHHIRIGLTIAVGTDQHYNLTLRRVVDNSVLGVVQLNRNADTGLCTADFLTYTYGAADPFVIDGFYLSLDNNSGAAVDITTSINLLITTYFK